MPYDYRYSQEARDRNLKIIWECDGCRHTREDSPGYNEGGECEMRCGGEYMEAGESHEG